jgi:hypothetical protein
MWSRLYEAVITAPISGREFHSFIEVLHFLCCATPSTLLGFMLCNVLRPGYTGTWVKFSKKFSKISQIYTRKTTFPQNFPISLSKRCAA